MVHKTISFPSEGRCIVIINQSFTIKLKWPIKTNSSETVLPPLIKTGVAGIGDNTHWTWAFWADLVTLAAPAAFLSTALMTPTVTISHVTHSKMARERIVREGLDTHGLSRNHINDGSNTRFQELGPSSAFSQNDGQSSPSAQQTCKQCELCDNPAQVHIQHWFGLDGSK